LSRARTDVHQHLITEPFAQALAARSEPPLVRRTGDGWALRLAGEPEYALDLAANDPARRVALVAEDGLDRALVCLSSALGVEALPPDEAAPLLEAYARGAAELPAPFSSWAAVCTSRPDPAELEARLDAGAVGLSLPVGALSGAEALDRCGALLETLERRGLPLLVHPGPAGDSGAGAPEWWPALTSYVAGMNAAWHAFVGFGRASHPRLRVLFVMLAGLAPLHGERLAARGGPAGAAAADPGIFLDTSSYGPRAIGAVAAVTGPGQLVYGSDRPVVQPAVPPLDPASFTDNPARLLGEI
jgi:predicted TIM-barrel fold metal-dependent hydrolase